MYSQAVFFSCPVSPSMWGPPTLDLRPSTSNPFDALTCRAPVAIMLKDDYFVRGAGLPGRFKAEKVEFHWGPSNGSDGSEHSVNGHRFPVEVSIALQ